MKKSESKTYGLIGRNIAYSFSPKYFTAKFERENIPAEYKLFDLAEISEVENLLKSGISGLNVTIPYKQEVIPFLDEITGAAKEINAVNTIQLKNGKCIGHNTDVIGFRDSIAPLLKEHHRKALILGTGGASKAVKYVFSELGIAFKVVSRSLGDFTYDELTPEIVEAYQIIVNCTPLGTSPNVDKCPDLPYDAITSQHLAYDLIYNPSETKFLQQAKAQGATIKNGLEMLEKQAEAAWDIWNG